MRRTSYRIHFIRKSRDKHFTSSAIKRNGTMMKIIATYLYVKWPEHEKKY